MEKIDLTKATKVENNIIARGEITNHSHIIVGEANVYDLDGELFIEVKGKAAIRHLLEKEYVEEKQEVWTGEHTDIELETGLYKYIPQIEYDPYDQITRKVVD